MSQMRAEIDRRDFLKSAALAGAGLGYFGMGLPMDFGGLLPARPTSPNAALRPFNMLVLGDSYISQPGLRKEERSWALIAAHIADELDGFRTVPAPRVFARSGAEIRLENDTPDRMEKDRQAPWPGSVPDAFWEDQHPGGDTSYAPPSIWRQLTRALDQTRPGSVDPREVDLVLLDGGGNDVTIGAIVNPFRGGNHHAWIRGLTRDILGARMKPLLRRVASAFPSARIVVTGYPQIVSGQSDSAAVVRYLGGIAAAGGAAAAGLVGAEAGGVLGLAAAPIIKEGSWHQTEVFAEESSNALQAAVNEVSVAHPGRVVFADVRRFWADDNAYAAPNSFLWLFTAPFDPPDHTHGARYEVCKTHGKVIEMATDVACAQGATGHFNVGGARAHADAAIAALDSFGVGWLGLKAMAVCADAVVVTAPKPITHGRNGTTISNETYSITVHARDGATNSPINATVAVTGKSASPVETAFRVQLCKTRQSKPLPKRGEPLDAITGCSPVAVTVRSFGYARVTFQAADIFDGEIPGSPEAQPDAVGETFHFCAPPTKIGASFDASTPPPTPTPTPTPAMIPTLIAVVTAQGKEGKKVPGSWWVIVEARDGGTGNARPAGIDSVFINGAKGVTGRKIVFTNCYKSEPGPCLGHVRASGFKEATFEAGPER